MASISTDKNTGRRMIQFMAADGRRRSLRLGKVAMPSEVLDGSGTIDATLRAAVEQHPEIGERLVRPLGFSSAIASAIRHHHEHFNGSGYPDRLEGSEIPLASRIISVADAFDAMTCNSPYAAALSTDAAMVELRKYSGSQFDPEIVDHIAEVVETSDVEIA